MQRGRGRVPRGGGDRGGGRGFQQSSQGRGINPFATGGGGNSVSATGRGRGIAAIEGGSSHAPAIAFNPFASSSQQNRLSSGFIPERGIGGAGAAGGNPFSLGQGRPASQHSASIFSTPGVATNPFAGDGHITSSGFPPRHSPPAQMAMGQTPIFSSPGASVFSSNHKLAPYAPRFLAANPFSASSTSPAAASTAAPIVISQAMRSTLKAMDLKTIISGSETGDINTEEVSWEPTPVEAPIPEAGPAGDSGEDEKDASSSDKGFQDWLESLQLSKISEAPPAASSPYALLARTGKKLSPLIAGRIPPCTSPPAAAAASAAAASTTM
jgi:hypothetical protein